jgi:hypothetical protein
MITNTTVPKHGQQKDKWRYSRAVQYENQKQNSRPTDEKNGCDPTASLFQSKPAPLRPVSERLIMDLSLLNLTLLDLCISGLTGRV